MDTLIDTKPWQVTIDYHVAVGHLFLRVRHHTHGSVAFSNAAIDYCGGAAEVDDDGYTIRCNEEPNIVAAAREIARLSEQDSSFVAPRGD
jgi:hypothetical protein